jgi:hypothetical protein
LSLPLGDINSITEVTTEIPNAIQTFLSSGDWPNKMQLLITKVDIKKMAFQSDLVKIKVELSPLAVIKG